MDFFRLCYESRVENKHTSHITQARNVWHEILGNCNSDVLRDSVPHMRGIIEREVVKAGDYEPCAFGKLVIVAKKPVAHKNKLAARPLKRLFFYLVDPMKHHSIGCSKYFVTLLNAGSGCSTVQLIHHKSEAKNPVLVMIQEMETLFISKVGHMKTINRNVVKWVRSDWVGEDIGPEFLNWLRMPVIVCEAITAFSPKSNRNNERLNRILIDIARTMRLASQKLGNDLWAEAVNNGCYIKDQLLTKIFAPGSTHTR